MRLNEFTSALNQTERMEIRKPDGLAVPAHFHITEIGKTTRTSIDCGGHPHSHIKATVQLFAANDIDHRLSASKVLAIINKTKAELGLQDEELEVEYQIDEDTIGVYGLEYSGGVFQLTRKHTDCLAKSECGIPEVSSSQPVKNSCCSPEAACC